MNLKNKIQFISLIILSSVLFSACTAKNSETNLNLNMNQNTSPTPTTVATSTVTQTPAGDTLVAVTTKDGQIVLKLYSNSLFFLQNIK